MKFDQEPIVAETTHFNAGRVRDLTAIIRAAGCLPRPATLFVEGTSISTDVRTFLAAKAVTPGREDLSGTIWPRSAQFHLPLEEEVVDGLCELADRHAEPEVCDHIVVYSHHGVLMAAYDAGTDDVWLAQSLSADERNQVQLVLGPR
jgi:hypothetical protein